MPLHSHHPELTDAERAADTRSEDGSADGDGDPIATALTAPKGTLPDALHPRHLVVRVAEITALIALVVLAIAVIAIACSSETVRTGDAHERRAPLLVERRSQRGRENVWSRMIDEPVDQPF